MQLLLTICKEYNTAMVMATHDYTILQKYPGRIVRIEQGKLVELTAAGYPG
ncbi:MAG: hypothetical protein QM743_08090 [Chitinophagaceae bacterium]